MNINIKNNYAPNIEVHEGAVVNLRQDKTGRWNVEEVEDADYVTVEKEALEKSKSSVPDRLKTQQAEELMEDLVDGGILKDNWQPNGLSGTERAWVAKAVSDRLDIKEVWQVFGQMWDEKPETLRSYLNKAFDQKKSLRFQEKLKNILG